jgi:hypothetical protein
MSNIYYLIFTTSLTSRLWEVPAQKCQLLGVPAPAEAFMTNSGETTDQLNRHKNKTDPTKLSGYCPPYFTPLLIRQNQEGMQWAVGAARFKGSQTLVAPVCNPTYSGSKDQEE